LTICNSRLTMTVASSQFPVFRRWSYWKLATGN
jgi:hypothetical protein